MIIIIIVIYLFNYLFTQLFPALILKVPLSFCFIVCFVFSSKIGSKISEVASLQVNAERRRLEQNQYIAESEKRLYVKVFDLSHKMILSGI